MLRNGLRPAFSRPFRPHSRGILFAVSLLGCLVLVAGVQALAGGRQLQTPTQLLAFVLLVALLTQALRAPYTPRDVLQAVGASALWMRGRLAADVRAALALCLLLAACFAFVIAAAALRPGEDALLGGLLILGMGGLLLGGALFFSLVEAGITKFTRDPPSAAAQVQPVAATHTVHSRLRAALTLHHALIAAGLALLWVVAEASGRVLPGQPMKDLSHHWQFALLCAGIALVVIGLGKASRRIPKGAEARPQNPQTHTERPTLRSFAQGAASRVALRVSPVLSLEIVLLALITLLAFVLRAWALGDTIRQFVDELNFGTVVYYYWVDDSVALLQPLIRGFPAIYAFFQAETVELWGRNLAGLRGASVLIGTLTIPATWLLAKTLFETAADRLQGDGLRRLNAVALLAAFLLAVFPAHIHFSRLGMNNIADPLVGVAMLAFLARGLKHGRQLDFALGGVFLGLSQYFYEAGKLVFPPLVVLWIGWLLLANRGLWRARWRGLLVALIAALIVAAPIYYTTFGLGQSLTPRFDDVGRIPFLRQITSHPDQLRIFFEKIGWAFRVYVNAYEYGVIYYGGQTAILPLYLVPAFFLGLWAVIWHLRRPVVVLPLTLVITSLGNGLLTEPRLYTRFNITFPLLSLLAAAGLVFAVRLLIQPYLLTRGQTILMRRLVFAGLVLTALVAAVAQIAYYYGPHLAMLNQQIRAYRLYDGQDALLRAAQLPAGTQVHVIAERTIDQNYARGILGFLTDDLSVNVVDPAALPRETLVQQLATLPRGVDHAFFIAPTDNTTLLILNQFFVLSGPAFSPYDLPAEKQLVLYMAYARDNTRPDLRVAFLEGAQDGR